MRKTYWWSAFVLLLISVSVEAQVSRVKMEGGVGFSSMRGMDWFDEAVHPFYFTVGAEYLDRDWFHLSSNVGVVRKGGKDSDFLYLTTRWIRKWGHGLLWVHSLH